MSDDGRIFASLFHEPQKFHHSSFLGGKPVASAGEIVVEKGIIKEVTRKSGHYQPKDISNIQLKKRLNVDKVNTENINFTLGF